MVADASKPDDLPDDGSKWLFNDSRMSDVRFVVHGQKMPGSFTHGGTSIYGHKFKLGWGSPVFEKMFFGEFKEQSNVVKIEDLTLVGFKNALRCIYGFKIDFEFTEICESFLAADKYLVKNFNENFFEYIKDRLTVKNSCLIYDQLVKVWNKVENRVKMPLDHVRTKIIQSSKEAFESEHFTQIDQGTLINLLSLDELAIDEFDLFTAVLRWVDGEVQRKGLTVDVTNRQSVFKPIKSYILFTAMKAEKIANGEGPVQLITYEERGSLVLHLLNKKNPWTIELKPRGKPVP